MVITDDNCSYRSEDLQEVCPQDWLSTVSSPCLRPSGWALPSRPAYRPVPLAGDVDHESRDRALERIWAEGADERNHREVEAHQVAMAEARMSDLSTEVDIPADAAAWRAMMSQGAIDNATPEQATKAWRDATALGADGDPVAVPRPSSWHGRSKPSTAPTRTNT